jgi:hypothetical protein
MTRTFTLAVPGGPRDVTASRSTRRGFTETNGKALPARARFVWWMGNSRATVAPSYEEQRQRENVSPSCCVGRLSHTCSDWRTLVERRIGALDRFDRVELAAWTSEGDGRDRHRVRAGDWSKGLERAAARLHNR